MICGNFRVKASTISLVSSTDKVVWVTNANLVWAGKLSLATSLKFSIKKIIEKHSILRSQFIHDVNCSFPSHLKQKLIKTELKLEIIEDSENDKDLIDKQIKKEIDFEFDLKSSDI